MKHFIQKTAAAALSLSLALGMSATAYAATESTNTYSLYVKDKVVQFMLDGKTAASYDINNDHIDLITDREGDFLVCFFDDRGTHKGVSLGNQKSLSVSGTISELRLDESLKDSISLTVASDALVKNLNVRTGSDITVKGRVSDLEVDAPAEIEVTSTGTVNTAELMHRQAKLHAEKGATVKRVQSIYRTNVTGNVDRVTRVEDEEEFYGYSAYDDDDRDAKYRVRLETDTIYARRGDTLRDLLSDLDTAVYAYVDDSASPDDGDPISGRVAWRTRYTRDELESSGTYGFTFTPSDSDYRTVRGTVRVIVR
ncbi:MAG: hypothetical protein HFG27_03025 [Provencibacterium sp.]|jgi:hypothetical protein|nr:hypothetical protein [Provencibacterium sp.]